VGGGSGLSSLWDSQPQQQAAQDPQSLRRGRSALPVTNHPDRQNPFTRGQSTEPPVQARPLPSQRAGSYQTAGAGAYGRGGDTGPPPDRSGSAGGTAQDRLKARLWGTARTTSLTTEGGSSAAAQASLGRNNSYGSPRSGGGGDYEDAFPPSAPSAGGGGGYGGGGKRPFVAATAPWASSESEFSGGGYGGGSSRQQQSGGGRTGLPSGSGAGRRGGGLSSGPRSMR